MGAAVAVRRTEAPPGHAVAPRGSRRSRDVVFAVSVALVAAGLFDAVVLRGTSGPIVRVALAIGIPLAVAAVVRCSRPMRRAGRAALGLTIGTAAVIAGAGMTIPRAVKAGPTVHGAVETLAVIGGVVLLVQAAVTALGGIRRRWLRLVAIPVGLVAVYYVIAPLTLAVYVTHPPHAVLADRTPADAGIAFRDVTLRTDDGVRLAAWYVPSRNGAAVVLLHGSGSTRTSVFDHLVALARHGYGVLSLDARGHGESGGPAMDWGWYGNRDVAAAVSFLERMPDVERRRIGAVGLSMGGEEALTAAAADPRIRAVVSEGASMRAFSDWGSIPAPAVSRVLSAPFYWVQSAAADVMTVADAPVALEDAAAVIAPRPVLLIAGSPPDELGFNERYAAAAPDTTTLWSLPDTPHVGAIHVHPDEWGRRVLGFLDRALLNTRGGHLHSAP